MLVIFVVLTFVITVCMVVIKLGEHSVFSYFFNLLRASKNFFSAFHAALLGCFFLSHDVDFSLKYQKLLIFCRAQMILQPEIAEILNVYRLVGIVMIARVVKYLFLYRRIQIETHQLVQTDIGNPSQYRFVT